MRAALPAAAATALAAGLLAARVWPPPPRLAELVRATPVERSGPRGLTTLLDRGVGTSLARRLRQAGMTRGRSPRQAAREHLAQVALAAALHGGVIAAVVLIALARPTLVLPASLLGALAGGARRHGEVERRLEQRRHLLRTELYTVNQLLSLDVRAGGGVAQAIERVAGRADGVVAEELRDVLATVRAGVPLAEALEQAAEHSPEPAAARTYRLLANGARFGTDLGTALRALNEDLRARRAEDVERAATRRRAAMLLPIVGLLAPVMLLFIVAPLPSLLFGIG